jgi:hypothetical protein
MFLEILKYVVLVIILGASFFFATAAYFIRLFDREDEETNICT